MEQKRIASPKYKRYVLGVSSIIAAVFLLSLSDALVKLASDRMALGQLVAVRSTLAALLIAVWTALFSGRPHLRLEWSRWIWLRSLSLATMWGCYYAALPSMSFALAAACYYTSPLWMALLSGLILKEPVGRLRWSAIILGLAGVVLVLNPGVAALSPIVALPLAAAIFYALAAIITWSRCGDEMPMSMALNLNITLALGGMAALTSLAVFGPGGEAGFLLSVWPGLNFGDWVLLGGLGMLLAVITGMVAFAYQLAPPPVIGVFDNAYLVFATLWGVLIFNESPGLREGVGLTLIGSGALLASCPRRLR